MIERHVELSQLKQEVAELWTRFRKDEPAPGDDDARRALATHNRNLEATRRVLVERRTTLRHELDVFRRRASRLAPVVRVFGGLIGVTLAGALVGATLLELAGFSVELTVSQGAGILTASLLVLALAVAPRDR
jgi:CBS domain-containing protein